MNRVNDKQLRFPFKFLEPTFYAGLLDDPLLLLRNRPAGRSLLFDCGQLHHVAKRVLKSVDAIFISHAHMDHFMGMATFVRNILVSPRCVNIYGPPGLSKRLENLLAGFDWNLCENFWCSLRVNEIGRSGISRYLLPGANRFRRESEKAGAENGSTIYRGWQVEVRAKACDHKIPSLIYRVDEKPSFAIDDARLAANGLVRGDWLRELNSRYNRDRLDGPIVVEEQAGAAKTVPDAAGLYREINAGLKGLSIGYLTDVGWSDANKSIITDFFKGIDLLVCECSYSREDDARARESCHLHSGALNTLMEQLQPGYVVPIHLSKSYRGETGRIFAELSPPAGTTLLRLPDHIAPKPLLPSEASPPNIVHRS